MEDSRFSKAARDPRFIRPKKKVSQVSIDKRFKKVFTDQEFTNPCPVDKYGRVKESSQKNDLKRFYHLEDDSDGENDVADQNANEEEPEVPISKSRISIKQRDPNYDPARGEGVIDTSDSDSDSDSDSNSDAGQDETALDDSSGMELHPLSEMKETSYGEATHRLALQNMDWDQIEASDLYILFNSFKPALGSIDSIKVYMSQFGKERIALENVHGPPTTIFKPLMPKKATKKKLDLKSNHASESDSGSGSSSGSECEDGESIKESTRSTELVNEQASDSESKSKAKQASDRHAAELTGREGDDELLQPSTGEDFNQEALRQYQLERLRYYYAIVECDSVATAQSIYENCDGREYEKSCNVIDLRYVPKEVNFDSEQAVQEATFESAQHGKPNEFITRALNHSNVKLTWDEDDPKRVKVTRAKFNRETLDEMDYKAYMASDGGSDSGSGSETEEAMIHKYKSLVNEENENSVFKRPSAAGHGADASDDVHMEVTFHSGLKESDAAPRSTAEKPETVFEATLRRQREKRKAQKAQLKSHTTMMEEKAEKQKDSIRKSGKQQEKKQNAALELLMMDDETADMSKKHFNLRDIVKQEKKKNRAAKKRGQQEGEVGDDFSIQVDDPRFSAVFESSHFAIDPSHSSFKDTKSMRKLLEEKRKRTSQKSLE